MVPTLEEKLSSLNRELSRSVKENNDEQCLEISKVIFIATQSKKSFQYQIIASIRLNLYHQALDLLEKTEPWSPLENEMLFEKAYCYYRTHQFEKAQTALNKLKNEKEYNKLAVLHLEAQILYATEDYVYALEIYKEIKSIIQEYDEEIETNITAIKACIAWNNREQTYNVDLIDHNSSYERLYNTACLYLGMNKLSKAKNLLEFARIQCSNKLNDADLSMEEKDKELMVIAAQLAYTEQLLDKKEEAKEIYEFLIASGTCNDTLTAIASNNLVALNQQISNSVDLFHSAKLLKLTRPSSPLYLEFKLFQQRNLLFNQALMQYHMKKASACRKILDQIPLSDRTGVCLILKAATEKKYDKRIDLLQQFTIEHKLDIPLHLALIQSLMETHKDEEALIILLQLLRRLNMNKLNIPIALTALLIWLYQRIGKPDRAYDLLDSIEEALDQTTLKKQIAAFNLKMNRHDIAAKQYESLVRQDPRDMQSMAGLITAYHHTDPGKADKYMNSLPKINIQHIHVDELEHISIATNSHKHASLVKKERKKKKRKPLLPIQLDKDPDPERWLPKSERMKKQGKTTK